VIALTPEGRRIQERLHPQHLASEERLLAALDAGERRQLGRLLSKLLVSLEE
jgi:DNA-binding MarR family transcriptional regulator